MSVHITSIVTWHIPSYITKSGVAGSYGRSISSLF
jgi:hypothetical protein